MNKKTLLLAILSFFLAFGQVANASDSEKTSGKHSCGCNLDFAKKLGLNADQKAKLKTLLDDARKVTEAKLQELKPLREQVLVLIRADKLDESKINDLINKKTTIVAAMMKNRITLKHNIYTLLNDQQKIKFEELMKKWETQRVAMKEKWDRKHLDGANDL